VEEDIHYDGIHAIKSKGQRKKALTQWHVGSAGRVISVVVVVSSPRL